MIVIYSVVLSCKSSGTKWFGVSMYHDLIRCRRRQSTLRKWTLFNTCLPRGGGGLKVVPRQLMAGSGRPLTGGYIAIIGV
jgi:hypothetical protein